MNEADNDALCQHLEEVRPIMEEFCLKHGFGFAPKKSLGRHPRLRIKRSGPINLWFDLMMGLDDNGRYIELFTPDVPYELSAGAFTDISDGSPYGYRFQKSIQCFSGRPFHEVRAILRDELIKHLSVIESWDVNCLEESGVRVELRGRP